MVGMDPLCLEALERAAGLLATPKNLERLASATSPEAARWAFRQQEFRARAKAKFALAEQMLFDSDGLEMASHERVAAFHAAHFPTGTLVADLGCGIGADTIALARRGPVVAFELDENRADIARHNVKVHGLEAEIRTADALAETWAADYAFADPARRTEATRLRDPEAFFPPPRLIAERMAGLKLGLLKLSPMLSDEFFQSLGGRTAFVSFDGECREALVEVGESANGQAPYRAIRVETGASLEESQGISADMREDPGAFLLEANPAAIRAHALDLLANGLDAAPLGDSNGYLTAEVWNPQSPDADWVRAFQVLGHGRADLRRIRAELQRLDLRIDAVKLRGVREDPARWQRNLRGEGRYGAVLCLYSVGKSLRYALAQPLAKTHENP